MGDVLMHTIINPTVAINGDLNVIEIPVGFNQILHYDTNGQCVEFSKDQRFLIGGLNAGIVTNSKIYYTSIPEKQVLPKIDLDINNLNRNKKYDLYIKDLPQDTFSFSSAKSSKPQQGGDCTIHDSDTSYVVNIK